MTNLTPATILNDLVSSFDGTVAVQAWGETSLFYNPDRALPRGVYFATIKEKDGANDSASKLDRDGIFRLNVGTSKPLYLERFGPPPPRPGKGGIVEGPWDFTKLNTLTPHPVYGWMSWVAVLNPSVETLGDIRPLIDAAYAKANCHDNAVAESFFNLLKRERIRRRAYKTREQARQDIFDYIEMFYNPKRKHARNGMLSPVDFENRQLNVNQEGV